MDTRTERDWDYALRKAAGMSVEHYSYTRRAHIDDDGELQDGYTVNGVRNVRQMDTDEANRLLMEVDNARELVPLDILAHVLCPSYGKAKALYLAIKARLTELKHNRNREAEYDEIRRIQREMREHKTLTEIVPDEQAEPLDLSELESAGGGYSEFAEMCRDRAISKGDSL